MNITILILGRLGDMILATPAFRLLKEKYPQSRITVIASRHNIDIPRRSPHVDQVILWNNSPLKLIQASWRLMTTRCDYYIDPKDHSSSTSRMIAGLVRAKKKILYRNRSSNNQRRVNVSDLNPEQLEHFTELVMLALVPTGIKFPTHLPRPELSTDPDAEKFATEFLAKKGIHEFVFINISAGKSGEEMFRTWAIEKWQQVIRHILEKDRRWVVLNAVGEMREYAQEYFKNESMVTIAPTRNINDLISFVQRSDMVISPDTSVVHISSAFDKPLVALYPLEEKNLRRFFPLNSNKELVMPEGDERAVNNIHPGQVINAYKSVKSMKTAAAVGNA